jgi:hypothetical protein
MRKEIGRWRRFDPLTPTLSREREFMGEQWILNDLFSRSIFSVSSASLRSLRFGALLRRVAREIMGQQ